MKAVQVNEPGSISVVDLPVPVPGPDDVVIRVGACGICGTDIHIIDGEFPPTVYPLVIGHEFGGEVTAVGDRVKGVAVGDRVGVDPTLSCGACYFCQRGMGNLCERWNAVGVGHASGGFAEYVSVPARVVYPIPTSLSMKAAYSSGVEGVTSVPSLVRRFLTSSEASAARNAAPLWGPRVVDAAQGQPSMSTGRTYSSAAPNRTSDQMASRFPPPTSTSE